MNKEHIIEGAVFATILAIGGIVCFLGYIKLHEPVWREPDSIIAFDNNQESAFINPDSKDNNSAGISNGADFAHYNVTPEQFIDALKSLPSSGGVDI